MNDDVREDGEARAFAFDATPLCPPVVTFVSKPLESVADFAECGCRRLRRGSRGRIRTSTPNPPEETHDPGLQRVRELKDEVKYAAITRTSRVTGNVLERQGGGGFSSAFADQDIPGVNGDCRRDMEIRMTDENGVSWELEVNPWRDLYEPWITRINEALDGFHDLPKPSLFDGPIGQLLRRRRAAHRHAGRCARNGRRRRPTSAAPCSALDHVRLPLVRPGHSGCLQLRDGAGLRRPVRRGADALVAGNQRTAALPRA